MEKLAFGKDSSETHETLSHSYYRNDYYISAAAKHLLALFLVVVVGCAFATLYNLIAMWPIDLASCLRRCVYLRILHL